MTNREFKEILRITSVSQADFARFTGVHPETVCRYVSGQYPIPGPVRLIAETLRDRPEIAVYWKKWRST